MSANKLFCVIKKIPFNPNELFDKLEISSMDKFNSTLAEIINLWKDLKDLLNFVEIKVQDIAFGWTKNRWFMGD